MSVKFAGHTPPPHGRLASPGNSIDSEEKQYLNEWSEISDKYQESFEEEEVENEEKEEVLSHVTHQPLPSDILLDDDLISDPNMEIPKDNEHDDEGGQEKEDPNATAIDGMDLETYMNSAINSKSENDENGTPEMMDTMMQGLDGVSPPESRRKRSVRIATPPSHRSHDSDCSSPSQHVLQSILHEVFY